MAQTAQQLAQQGYDKLSFFILSGLPEGSEAGVDGKIWQVAAFEGFKFIPPGLHLFIVSAAPTSSSTPATISGGVGVRHGLLRFFTTSETIVESWSNQREEFESDRPERISKRRRTVPAPAAKVEGTVISQDYLKSLDKKLAAYPPGLQSEWSLLTNFISPTTVARVVGFDEAGNAITDAVMGSTADEEELKAAGGRQTWGKVREEGLETDLEEGDGEAVDALAFVRVDGKKSWPEGARGEELSRWSKDKSWQVSNIVKGQLGGDVKELLSELQLSFILFTLLHNFSSLAVYKVLFSLLSRSPTLLL
ncbi:A1 cistron-splicing factor AAR2, partial [Phenoliferia sp. Uapishka_3]